MKNWWLRISCFLTDYNFEIVKRSSEMTARSVKRYSSALLIVCILWAFIGYSFSSRYLGSTLPGSILGATIFVIIIVQIERQIISGSSNPLLYLFRAFMAILMALIGSIIIDQLIFREDIEQEKAILLGEKVRKILPDRAMELRNQIKEIQNAISSKETERTALMKDISANPTIKTIERTKNVIPIQSSVTDSLKNVTTKTQLIAANSISVKSINNPKLELVAPLDVQILNLRKDKNLKDSLLLTLQTSVENEIRSKVGFLDELIVMKRIITNSPVALVVWLCWMLFLLFLELFILISKKGDGETDYDHTLKHQMDLQIKRLDLLAQASTPK